MVGGLIDAIVVRSIIPPDDHSQLTVLMGEIVGLTIKNEDSMEIHGEYRGRYRLVKQCIPVVPHKAVAEVSE